MRPRELTVSGLTSFTDRVVVDFTDASLFALVGPTGAGKSSIVDALTLALYGRIPRLHANEIAPAISTTASECTVGLTFTVRRQPYRAVRTIRRTKTGASTLEAALERLDDDGRVLTTLAGTADDVTLEVEALLGLSFDEFTRAVVLPQGEFAKVLKAKPGDRQSLLARLLGTGIYDRVKQRAGAHARAASERAQQTAHQIAQLGDVSAERITALAERTAALDTLLERLTVDTEQLAEIRDRYREASAAASAAADRVARLSAIEAPPAEVVALADHLAEADRVLEKAQGAVADADAQLAEAEDGAPDPERLDQLSRTIAAHDRTAELTAAREQAEAALPALRTQIESLAAALAEAEGRVAEATAAQGRVHREHAAVQAVDGLAPGDDCPVCATALTDDAPAFATDAEAGRTAVEQAGRAVTEAVQAVAATRTRLERARTDLADATATRDRAVERHSAHLEALAGQPGKPEAEAELHAARQHTQRLAGLRREARQARDDLQQATRARQRLTEQAGGQSQRLDRMRLAVAELDPPALSGEVVADWERLHGWAAEALPAARRGAEEAAAAVTAVQAEGTELRSRMEQACAAADVPTGGGDPRDRAVQARADANAEVTRLRQVAEMVAGLRTEEEDAREQAAVGGELAKLLRADQFQKWLLDEATRTLVLGASAQLQTLSSGRYELSLDGRGSIQVVDLASAGATRSVRTLSGGETFLASLALALSLAEQIATAATGPVALESRFIDEGFGALDAETLDIATGAIETLGAGERTVGVITHVADMADRMPIRYVVSRTAAGSRVERVEA